MFHVPSSVGVTIPPLLIAIVIVGTVIGTVFSVNAALDTHVKRWNVALSSWMSDCSGMKRTIDDCAFAWKNNSVLQQVYFAGVSHEE